MDGIGSPFSSCSFSPFCPTKIEELTAGFWSEPAVGSSIFCSTKGRDLNVSDHFLDLRRKEKKKQDITACVTVHALLLISFLGEKTQIKSVLKGITLGENSDKALTDTSKFVFWPVKVFVYLTTM